MARVPTGFRKRPGGGFEKRFTVDGVRFSVYGSTIKECQEREQQKRDQLKAGIYHTNDTITLKQYFNEWIKQKENHVKGETIAIYKSVFRNNIEPFLGRYKVKNIEKRQIVSMLNTIAASDRKGAANYAKRVMVSLLKSAVDNDIISRNVAIGIPPIKMDKKPARETIHRELTEQELKDFFKLIARSLYFYAFQFMLYSGVRGGECCGLQWRDIDLKNGLIHIMHTTTRDKDGKRILGTPKTKKSRRDIPINDALKKIIEKQWEIYQDTHEVLALNDFVFSDSNGEMANPTSLNSVLRATLRKGQNMKPAVLITPFSIHAFRDTFASRAIRAGIAPNTLKEILGHASLAMTMDLYAHVSQRDKIEGMNKMKAINF